MKKIVYSLAIVATFAFASCGGGTSVCDCMKMGEESAKEVQSAGGDEAKLKEIEEKYKSKAEECQKLSEGKTDEERMEMMEEAKNCK